jgi:hypothetical protein
MENLRVFLTFLLIGGGVGLFMSGLSLLLYMTKLGTLGRYIPNAGSLLFLIYIYFEATLDTTGWAGLGFIIMLIIIIIANIVNLIINYFAFKKLK